MPWRACAPRSKIRPACASSFENSSPDCGCFPVRIKLWAGSERNEADQLTKHDDRYDPPTVERRWQQAWTRSGIYQADLLNAERPFYNLMMFPYPSAEGLHVGNLYSFTGADIY